MSESKHDFLSYFEAKGQRYGPDRNFWLKHQGKEGINSGLITSYDPNLANATKESIPSNIIKLSFKKGSSDIPAFNRAVADLKNCQSPRSLTNSIFALITYVNFMKDQPDFPESEYKTYMASINNALMDEKSDIIKEYRAYYNKQPQNQNYQLERSISSKDPSPSFIRLSTSFVPKNIVKHSAVKKPTKNTDKNPVSDDKNAQTFQAWDNVLSGSIPPPGYVIPKDGKLSTMGYDSSTYGEYKSADKKVIDSIQDNQKPLQPHKVLDDYADKQGLDLFSDTGPDSVFGDLSQGEPSPEDSLISCSAAGYNNFIDGFVKNLVSLQKAKKLTPDQVYQYTLYFHNRLLVDSAPETDPEYRRLKIDKDLTEKTLQEVDKEIENLGDDAPEEEREKLKERRGNLESYIAKVDGNIKAREIAISSVAANRVAAFRKRVQPEAFLNSANPGLKAYLQTNSSLSWAKRVLVNQYDSLVGSYHDYKTVFEEENTFKFVAGFTKQVYETAAGDKYKAKKASVMRSSGHPGPYEKTVAYLRSTLSDKASKVKNTLTGEFFYSNKDETVDQEQQHAPEQEQGPAQNSNENMDAREINRIYSEAYSYAHSVVYNEVYKGVSKNEGPERAFEVATSQAKKVAPYLANEAISEYSVKAAEDGRVFDINDVKLNAWVDGKTFSEDPGFSPNPNAPDSSHRKGMPVSGKDRGYKAP